MKMQTNCILIASNFASRYPYWLQIKFFNSLLFYLFTFAINLWHRKFLTADVTMCLSTVNMAQNDANKILIKLLFEISTRKDLLF